ncbi:MAG TPA: serine/threonine-protein kinase, partial [Gemmatimonadaceae bacterium]|nr:serine/threonine-protein kinase [Gemmatimonadaceae bacterium]
MSTPRWQRLDALFHEALECPASERAAFLDAACGGDAALRREVKALLDADAAPGDPLGEVVADAAQRLDATRAVDLTGQRIGSFRVGREIGRGGMGAVYLGERDDGGFAQRVALKVIGVGASAPATRARFLRERQILAALQHPGIARLVDGGVTDAGQPWFAMEYVEGERIDAWCARTQASLATRLRLFDEACRAIAYAHARLVVHRDLKPEHLLVTADGDVRVLDFGIAKALVGDGGDGGSGGDPTPGATPPTVTTLLRGLPMTPAYASPEQARGEPVGTATDVYALGVILYELLTGHRPYEVRDATPETLADAIAHATPLPPSARAEAPPVPRARLVGDLDAICLKALAKDPARRYATVEALREDLARFAERRPVRAVPPTLRYRLRTLVRRYPAASTIGALAVVALVAVTGWYTQRLATERDLARREAARAREVADFLRTLFEVADPETVRGDTITVRTMLDRGAERIDRALAGQPRLRADLTELLGGAFVGLGLPERGEALLASALAVRERLPHATPLELA